MHELPFGRIAGYPEVFDAPGVLARLLDGLGFRLRWATEGLRDEEWAYRAAAGLWSIGEITAHIWGLTNWMCIHLLEEEDGQRPGTPEEQRRDALHRLLRLRERLGSLASPRLEELRIQGHPVWHAINGPVADALTHVGQISYLRRATGNPVPGGVNVFLGQPPG